MWKEDNKGYNLGESQGKWDGQRKTWEKVRKNLENLRKNLRKNQRK